MRKIIFIGSLISLFATSAWSQDKYTVEGQVFDEMAMPVPFANVGIYELNNTVPFGGCATDFEGIFKHDIPPGDYKIVISFIGYKTYIIDSLHVASPIKIPSTQMSPDAHRLDNVIVVSERPTVQSTPGVKTYNISETAASEASSALDVIKTIPSASVDGEDDITMRGRKVTIMIDGVETNIQNILEQIPADQIESVEVINNPSAKYDTQNGEAILNIKLKKSKKSGYSSFVSYKVGNDGLYNPSVGGSATKNKLSLDGSISLSWNKYYDWSFSERTSYRLVDTIFTDQETIYVKEPSSYNNQSHFSEEDQFKQFYRLRTRYQINDHSNLQLSLNAGMSSFQKARDYHLDVLNQNKDTVRMSDRLRSGDYEGYWWKSTLQYLWKEHDGHEFKAVLEFYDTDGQDDYIFLDSLFSAQGAFQRINRLDLVQDGTREYYLDSKIDYERPINSGHSFETGLSARFRAVTQDYQYYNDAQPEDEVASWDISEGRSNVYEYDDQILSAYAVVKGPTVWIDKMSYSAGLRYNAAFLSPKSETDTISNDSRHFYWSPSIQMSYEFNDIQTLSFSYSRKTKLPHYYRLNPFITYYGPTSVSYGNAQLKPEIIDTYDLSYDVSLLDDNLFVNISAYYKDIHDIAIRYQFDEIDEEGDNVLNRTYRNVRRGNSYGLELVETWKIKEPIQVKSSFNLNSATYTSFSVIQRKIVQRNGTNFNIKTSADWDISKSLSSQLSFNYFGRRVTAQGYYQPNYFMDFSARQKLLKDDRLSLSFLWTDVLQTWNRDRVINREDTYYADETYSRNTFRYSITARYSLNKIKFS